MRETEKMIGEIRVLLHARREQVAIATATELLSIAARRAVISGIVPPGRHAIVNQLIQIAAALTRLSTMLEAAQNERWVVEYTKNLISFWKENGVVVSDRHQPLVAQIIALTEQDVRDRAKLFGGWDNGPEQKLDRALLMSDAGPDKDMWRAFKGMQEGWSREIGKKTIADYAPILEKAVMPESIREDILGALEVEPTNAYAWREPIRRWIKAAERAFDTCHPFEALATSDGKVLDFDEAVARQAASSETIGFSTPGDCESDLARARAWDRGELEDFQQRFDEDDKKRALAAQWLQCGPNALFMSDSFPAIELLRLLESIGIEPGSDASRVIQRTGRHGNRAHWYVYPTDRGATVLFSICEGDHRDNSIVRVRGTEQDALDWLKENYSPTEFTVDRDTLTPVDTKCTSVFDALNASAHVKVYLDMRKEARDYLASI